ncbi:uncharacterized protein B0H18DRAFT_99425 [Fomitopsis serialis]|uniref:uncharacterized protein n=1 Tax=Fomitopsis serialis TaxID=139415 RepID=UPI002008DA00|nr:uncharacterized protein B0H18DRAFT_99425 [Neoantrodia serialis]KAH9915333.1 hypothetical protein B0H18DRAFT_99425 [Neoantrodia serialis]
MNPQEITPSIGTSTCGMLKSPWRVGSISERSYADDGDVLVSSCDGVRFRVHKRNLHMHSEIFPGDDFLSDDIVNLSEDSSTLELLFQYMYQPPQPDLRAVTFEQLAKLAEAAEKYRVLAAMENCKVSMRASLSTCKEPFAVLGYAARHGHKDISAEAALRTLSVSAKDALDHLGPAHFIRWCLYRDPWVQALLDAYRPPPPGGILHKGGLWECDLWKPFVLAVVDDMGHDLEAPLQFSSVLERNYAKLQDCWHCKLRAQTWRDQIHRRVAELRSFQF